MAGRCCANSEYDWCQILLSSMYSLPMPAYHIPRKLSDLSSFGLWQQKCSGASVGSSGVSQIECEMEFVQLLLFKQYSAHSNPLGINDCFLGVHFPWAMTWTTKDNNLLVSSTKVTQAARMLCVSLYLL